VNAAAAPLRWRLRHALDVALHPLRRRWAAARLRTLGLPRSVTFICHGNICRSPYAAAAFWQRLSPSLQALIRVDSAGFVGPGRAAPSSARAVAAVRGVDLAAHRSKLVAAALGGAGELVVVMEPRQARALRHLCRRNGGTLVVLGDFDPDPITTRAIADPIGQPETAFQESYARIDRCLDGLVRAMVSESPRR
jgi:protein-tyrosine phosphatase